MIKEIIELEKESAIAHHVYYNTMKDIWNRVARVQEQCKHVHTTYTPDASGNNDSSTDCDDCGATWSERKQKFVPDPTVILHWSP